MGYFIVSNQNVSGRIARRLPIFIVLPQLTIVSLYLVSRVKASIGFVLGHIYSDFMPEVYYGYSNASNSRQILNV